MQIFPLEKREPVQSNGKDIMDMTLRDLQNDPNATVFIKNGKTTIQIKNETGTLRADITNFSFGEDRHYSFTPSHDKTSQLDFEYAVMQRLNEGQTQVSVASSMGISQSRVSQIKRKYEL